MNISMGSVFDLSVKVAQSVPAFSESVVELILLLEDCDEYVMVEG